MDTNKIYAAIDLKSFYASVECRLRNLDPLDTNLVVADESRTDKTICLAVSPSLKSYGIPGRARLFEVKQRLKEINSIRRGNIKSKKFSGKSYSDHELKKSAELEIDAIIAKPHMGKYMDVSTQIYDIYLRYIAPEDMHIYSVDEVFIDLTPYLKSYRKSAREIVMMMINDVLNETGITATAGIGTNLYLCKIAMDIVAKKAPADSNGVRIAELSEQSYRELLWDHKPLTDFWRIGTGISKKLEYYGIYTMGDIARCSVGNDSDFYNETLLYKLFGINAELIIDHAWGWEPCTMKNIKSYRPSTNSLSSGQVLKTPYNYKSAKLVVREMTELLSLDLVKKSLVTNQIVLTVGYDISCLTNSEIKNKYIGEIKTDHYGRKVPKHAHGSKNLEYYTSSTKSIVSAMLELFDNIVNPDLLVRRMYVVANNIVCEGKISPDIQYEQLNLFSDYNRENAEKEMRTKKEEREKSLQRAIIKLEKKYGKNTVLKAMNLQEDATTIERNGQIGGHKA